MKVDYIDHMGSDLSVVNAARVSFDKQSEDFSDRDKKLIKYLANHKHWTPFSHTSISLRVKAPIFVARQLGKHQVGLVWNEVSRRYVDSDPEFYYTDCWRGRPENSKQGSSEKKIPEPTLTFDSVSEEGSLTRILVDEVELIAICSGYYKKLLENGVCPEQARMVLPQSMYTEWIWTGNLVSFSNMCKLRLDSHTQKETREVAKMINDVIEPLFPVSWKELMNDER